MKRCQYCGKENKDDAHYCRECGSEIPDAVKREADLQEQKHINRGLLVALTGVVGCVLLFSGVGIALLVYYIESTGVIPSAASARLFVITSLVLVLWICMRRSLQNGLSIRYGWMSTVAVAVIMFALMQMRDMRPPLPIVLFSQLWKEAGFFIGFVLQVSLGLWLLWIHRGKPPGIPDQDREETNSGPTSS